MAPLGRLQTIAVHKSTVRFLERARGLAKFLEFSLVFLTGNHKADGQGITAVALASRFWGLGCPRIFHEVATHLKVKTTCCYFLSQRKQGNVLMDQSTVKNA